MNDPTLVLTARRLRAERILETYPPLQSTKHSVAPSLANLLRKPLPAQALAITGTAKYLRKVDDTLGPDVFTAASTQQGRQGSHLLVVGGDGANGRRFSPEDAVLVGGV